MGLAVFGREDHVVVQICVGVCHRIIVRSERNRPQPNLDRDAEKGMATTVGRVRECPLLGTKFVLLGHNTIRGAAGASILNAELFKVEGLLPV